MLPLSTCRELLPSATRYTDEELERIRLQLYQLAEVCIENYLHDMSQKAGEISMKRTKMLQDFDDALWEIEMDTKVNGSCMDSHRTKVFDQTK